jgi:hypothetical protein
MSELVKSINEDLRNEKREKKANTKNTRDKGQLVGPEDWSTPTSTPGPSKTVTPVKVPKTPSNGVKEQASSSG